MNLNRCPECHRRYQRTHPQNKRYWALLHEMSEGIHPSGEQFSAPTWHLEMRRRFLGCTDTRLPTGRTQTTPISTTDLDVAEFNDYMTQVEVFASERGVFLPDEDIAA